MIDLNSRQGLPPSAFWYLLFRSLLWATIYFLAAMFFQLETGSHNVTCSGLPCRSGSGVAAAAFLYLYAAGLVVSTVLRFKWYSFVLTDKTLSVQTGALFQRSTTFRLDKIQDIDTLAGPLRRGLGLKSVAIWTASLDQRSGNRKKPDGSVLLEADRADWLRGYLADPAAAATVGARPVAPIARKSQTRVTSGSTTDLPTGAGWVLTLILCVFLALVAAGMKHRGERAAVNPNTASAPAAASARATPATVAPATAARAMVPIRTAHVRVTARPAVSDETGQAATTLHVSPTGYAVACAIHGSGGLESCADLAEAQRCEREADFPSLPTPPPAVLTVVNRSDEDLKFYWLNPSGSRVLYATLHPGGNVMQQSHLGAHWLVSTQSDRCIAVFDAATKTVGIF